MKGFQERRKGMRKLLCLLCALCALPMGGMAETVPELLEPVGVMMDTVEAYVGDLTKVDLYDGYVRPYVEGFSFSREGTVGEMHVVVGQKVKAGDPLISLDQEEQEERMEALQDEIGALETNGMYADALAGMDLSILEVELRALMNQSPRDAQAIALKELDIEEKKLDMALEAQIREMELSRLQEELSLLESQRSQNVLYAPFDATVMFCAELEHGSYVSAYSPVIYLADDTRLTIETQCISQTITNSALEIYALVGGSRYALKVVPIDITEHISKVLSGEKVMTQFTIDAPDDSLESGMYAAVCLRMSSVEDALLVPSNALYRDGSGQYVYVIEDGERVRREVETGLITDWETQILEGLEEGAVVYVKD